MSQMLEDEGFFLNCHENDANCTSSSMKQTSQLSHIFQLTVMLQGPIIFILSIINDNVGYGVARSASYVSLSLCYLVLAISTPSTPMLQYIWILHHPAALALVGYSFKTVGRFKQNNEYLCKK